MATKMFVSLAVKNLKASKAFFEGIGFSFNADFTNDEAACMVISDSSFVMLLPKEKFTQFTSKEIADPKKTCQVIVALSAEDRESVDQLIKKAIDNGATESRAPQDHGFMYSRGFEDLDGNLWESIWVNLSATTAEN